MKADKALKKISQVNRVLTHALGLWRAVTQVLERPKRLPEKKDEVEDG